MHTQRKTSDRRVWDCIPLGYEIDMLWLHMRTLQHVVDGFIVTESDTTHTTTRKKPLLLTEIMANGSLGRQRKVTRRPTGLAGF